MSAEHTPTPWRVFASGDRHGIDASIRQSIVVFGHTDKEPDMGVLGATAEEAHANAAFIVRAANCHDELVNALDTIFSRVSYVNIHGVGDQPEPTGEQQLVRVSREEFWRLFQEIGTIAAAALAKAEGRS